MPKSAQDSGAVMASLANLSSGAQLVVEPLRSLVSADLKFADSGIAIVERPVNAAARLLGLGLTQV